MSREAATRPTPAPPRLPADTITMAHGSGGKAMQDLIAALFIDIFDNPHLTALEDQARFELADLAQLGDRLAMTTDSYVVDPLFFPGGDIGKLAVCGTVNDLAVGGAKPLFLSCGMIIEEGFSVETLRKICLSMKAAADAAGVKIVTGDTKVVPRGAADKLFINTAGVGVIREQARIDASSARVGDRVVINGYIGDHGAAIVDARGDMALDNSIESDCQPLNSLIETMLDHCPEIRCIRDATRGGVATLLNDFAKSSGIGIRLQEAAIPIRDQVRGVCEILGLDPLYLANEGKLVAVVPAEAAESLVELMRQHAQGGESAVIAEVIEKPAGRVVLATQFGGERIVDLLIGEQLPRIC